MKNPPIPRRLALTALAAAALSGGGTAHACSTEPIIGTLCVAAWPRNGAFNGTYQQAVGTLLPLQNYAALYALIGTSYGGDGRTNFGLPDLRGRTVLGAGPYNGPATANAGTTVTYVVGQTGGVIGMSNATMPLHAHTLGTAQGRVSVTTAMTGVTAATSLSGVSGSVSGSSLVLNSATGGNLGTNPGGASIGNYTGTVKIYSDAAPTVAMKTGSIGGSAPVSFSGNPTTTLTGSPTVTVGGTTDNAGGAGVSTTLTPYVVMNYYIAVNGIFPNFD